MAKVPPMRDPKQAGDLPAPPDNKIIEGQEEYEVNSCSLHTTEHEEGCDGNCEKQTLPATAVKIHNELHAWARAGMTVDMVPHNVFNIDAQVLAIIRMLIEKEVTTEDEFNDLYRELLLEKLQSVRKQNEPTVRKARAQQNLAVAQKRILGPNGTILGE